MIKAFLRRLAVVSIALFAVSAFAEANSGIEGTVESGVATLKSAASNANGTVLDIIVINYTDPKDNLEVNQLLPIPLRIPGGTSGRSYTENYSKGDYIEVKFNYGNGKVFDKVVYRRTTVSVYKDSDPIVTEYRA
jgi:hypothetical protein